MNADLSIHRMAFREAESMGVAQALVARKRQELELRLQREKVLEGASGAEANLDAALKRMEEESEAAARAAKRRNDDEHRVDKTA